MDQNVQPRTDTPEPSPWRDTGPYDTAEQARVQAAATTSGIPAPADSDRFAASMVLHEALLLGGVDTTPYETRTIDALAHQLDPATAQVVAGWIIRARLAGLPATA